MTDILGFEVPLPKLSFQGALSGSWIYILIIGFIGLLLIIGIIFLLFFRTYNRKVVIFEKIAGIKYEPTIKTRARIVRLGNSGEEILKTLAGNKFLTAYGEKMGKNSFWFAKGPDGYLYNVLLGDLDTKLRTLDIVPVDRDVRMFHIAIDRLSHETYDRKGFIEKYGVQIISIIFLVILIVGMVVIISRIGKSTEALASTAQTNQKVLEALKPILQGANNLQEQSQGGVSGLVPVT